MDDEENENIDEELSDNDIDLEHDDCNLKSRKKVFIEYCGDSIKTCPNCIPTRKKTNAHLAEQALRPGLMDFFTIDRCERGCDRKCMDFVTMKNFAEYRIKFWGNHPTGEDRRNKINIALQTARDEYVRRGRATSKDQEESGFVFIVGGKDVCEKAFANLLGLADLNGSKGRMWYDCLKIFNGEKVKESTKSLYLNNDLSHAPKREHAFAYILDIIESGNMCDRSAMVGHHQTLYLPYLRKRFFFGEYEYFCKNFMVPLHQRAQEKTFTRAFNEVVAFKKLEGVTIAFSSGKGSFDKCAICFNADNLYNGSNLSELEKNIILTYRRRHIEQQFAERVTLQQNIASTYKMDDRDQPSKALLFTDAMTCVKGDTPKYGKGRPSKEDTAHITSRIIGVEVHCGPIHGTILYYTDNLIGSGANITIEVLRQSILDLQDMLASHKNKYGLALDMPQDLILQFDNCSENKNKFVFAYISLLVQNGLYKTIEVFLLIVGHTQASIDQYFSVCARQIRACGFLGSPLALEALLAKEDVVHSLSGNAWTESIKSKPLLVRKISVVFDMKEALLPLINKKIQYYPIPHRFKFELYYSVCCMQYAMFSTHKELLPRRPSQIPDFYSEQNSLDIVFDLYSLVGGEASFKAACGATEVVGSNESDANFEKILEIHSAIFRLKSDFQELELKSIRHAVLKENGSDIEKSLHILEKIDDIMTREISKMLQHNNTAREGVIFWLVPGVSRLIRPKPLFLFETCQFLLENSEYDPTGFNVYEIYNQDLSYQYEKIYEFLQFIKENKRAPESGEIKSIDSNPIRKLRALFFDNDYAPSKPIMTKLDSSAGEIITAARAIFGHISSGRVQIGDGEGIYILFLTL